MTHLDKMAQRVTTFLARWQGARAQLWDYTASHRSLTIRLTREGYQGNMHVDLVAVDYISGPVHWTDSDIRFARTHTSVRDVSYVVWDRKAGFVAICGVLEAAENVKPVY